MSLPASTTDPVSALILDATRLALALNPDVPDLVPGVDLVGLDVLRVLASLDLRIVPDSRGLARRAIRRVELERSIQRRHP